MIFGILFILSACFCWGLIFVVPQFLSAYSAIEIALGRFFFFGVLSWIVLATKKRHLLQRSYWLFWRKAILLGFFATLVPYMGLVLCLRYANPPVTALIYGLAPITISFCGNWKANSARLQPFYLPGLLTLSGLVLTNLDAFYFIHGSSAYYFLGLLCAIGGLAAWTWYAVDNAAFMKKHPEISSLDWVTLIGSSTFLIVFTIVLCLLPFSENPVFRSLESSFLLGSGILGVISTYAAFLFWNHGTRRLPIHLVGQLAVFEMLFGLLFIFFTEKRLPHVFELGGILFILSAVLIVLRREQRMLKAGAFH